MKNLIYIAIGAFLLSMTLYACASSDETVSTSTATSTFTVKGGM